MSAAPTPGAPEKAAVRSMFDRIAPRYDLLNRLLSAGTDVRWRRQAVDFLDLPPGGRVLDFCTGTADLLIEALSRDGRREGLGVDLSHGMLVRGAVKLGRGGYGRRARLVGGDSERLPVRDGLFDGALVAFGIRNVGDPLAGLVSGDGSAYAYLPASVATFPAPEAFGALMEQAGFRDVRWRLLTGGIACLHRGETPR